MVAILFARKILVCPAIIAILSVGMVGASILPAGGSEMGAEYEEVIPNEDQQLTPDELRWCIFESARLSGERDEINTQYSWEVDNYNERSTLYQERCYQKNYHGRDKTAVEDELTTGKRAALREHGAARVRDARAEREARRVHVKEQVARVLVAPEHAAAELGRVPRWGDLITTGRVQGPWHEAEWRAPSMERALTLGWVLGGLLEGGSGEEARFRHCETHAHPRAQHNEVVRKDIDLVGPGEITIENGANSDSYLKLIRNFDEKVISVFVEKGKTAVVDGISSGSYEVAFATGSKFSRGCNSFSLRGAAQRFDRQIDYDRRTAGWTLTLYSTSDGNARTSSMSYDDFDRL
jgi:hypothetical protein